MEFRAAATPDNRLLFMALIGFKTTHLCCTIRKLICASHSYWRREYHKCQARAREKCLPENVEGSLFSDT
jgi:hypothetical protein